MPWTREELQRFATIGAPPKPVVQRACTHPLLDFNFRPLVSCAKCGEILTGYDPRNHVGLKL